MVTLSRFEGKFENLVSTNKSLDLRKVKHGIVLDLETSGLNSEFDEIIEISYLRFEFTDEKNAKIVGVGELVTHLQEPRKKISKEVSIVTGYKDEELVGHKIDWSIVKSQLEMVDLIVAHNAAFDRTFLEKTLKGYKNKAIWACSFRHIDWLEHGFVSSNLELLCLHHGFFVHFHKGSEDCIALLRLLLFNEYFAELYINCHQPLKIIKISGFPFERKGMLVSYKFKWNPKRKFWYFLTGASEPSFVAELKRECKQFGALYEELAIPPTENFSLKWTL